MSNCVSRTLLVLFAALAVVSCGGGGESTSTEYTLAVQTLDTSGRPVAGVGVSLSFANIRRVTDADGKASFTFTATGAQLAGDEWVSTESPAHHMAVRRFQIDDVQGQLLQLSLLRLEQATPRVMGVVSAEASADASALTVEALVAVTDETGRLIDTLTPADFGVPDCGSIGTCIFEPSGQDSGIPYQAAPGPNPLAATITGSAPTAAYRVRFAIVAVPGTFVPGRTVFPSLTVRLGVDTVAYMTLEIRL